MLKLRINPIVAKDLKNIKDYIAEDNEDHKRNLWQIRKPADVSRNGSRSFQTSQFPNRL